MQTDDLYQPDENNKENISSSNNNKMSESMKLSESDNNKTISYIQEDKTEYELENERNRLIEEINDSALMEVEKKIK